jgi:hypothetical protein
MTHEIDAMLTLAAGAEALDVWVTQEFAKQDDAILLEFHLIRWFAYLGWSVSSHQGCYVKGDPIKGGGAGHPAFEQATMLLLRADSRASHSPCYARLWIRPVGPARGSKTALGHSLQVGIGEAGLGPAALRGGQPWRSRPASPPKRRLIGGGGSG